MIVPKELTNPTFGAIIGNVNHINAGCQLLPKAGA
jgi:hypothetical protein